MKRDLVIFGSGGGARDVHAIARDLADDGEGWAIQGFLDGDPKKHGTEVHSLPVLGDASWLASRPRTFVVIGVGDPKARSAIASELGAAGHEHFATLIHPTAWRGHQIVVGEGTVISAGCLLSTDIHVGAHVLINVACSLTHDDVVESFAVIAPGVRLSGNVRVNEGADVGTGAIIRQGIIIGAWSVVGAGAVVIRDVPQGVMVVGVPAEVKERAEKR